MTDARQEDQDRIVGQPIQANRVGRCARAACPDKILIGEDILEVSGSWVHADCADGFEPQQAEVAVDLDLVWGVDCSTKRIAFASTRGGVSASLELPKLPQGGARLAAARFAIRDFASDFAGDHPPMFVWVEAPTGKFPAPTLIHMVGVTMEAIYSALALRYPYPVSVENIAIPAWKSATVGSGNAGKAQIMDWALTKGKPANQDEADALGIAYGGLAAMGSQGAAAA